MACRVRNRFRDCCKVGVFVSNEMIMTVSAIVTAYVAVFKAFGVLDNKFLPLVALGVAAVFVLVPNAVYTPLVDISTIGLISSGVYKMAKGYSKGKE